MSEINKYTIQKRCKHLINTDPQRRCYNGCHFSSELVWGGWDWIEFNVPEDRIEDRLTFWRELNDYAVSARGEMAEKEFKAVAEEDV